MAVPSSLYKQNQCKKQPRIRSSSVVQSAQGKGFTGLSINSRGWCEGMWALRREPGPICLKSDSHLSHQWGSLGSPCVGHYRCPSWWERKGAMTWTIWEGSRKLKMDILCILSWFYFTLKLCCSPTWTTPPLSSIHRKEELTENYLYSRPTNSNYVNFS